MEQQGNCDRCRAKIIKKRSNQLYCSTCSDEVKMERDRIRRRRNHAKKKEAALASPPQSREEIGPDQRPEHS